MKYLKSMALVLVLFALAPLSTFAQKGELQEVSVIKAKLMLRNGSTMIDVREPSEIAEVAYDVSSIIYIPLGELQGRMNEVPKNTPLVIACRSGARSRKASNMLLASGYTDIVNMEGGMLEWQAKNLEVIKDGQSPKKACCANPNSKDCNPDGTCKPGSESAKKACCADPNSKDCNPDGTCKPGSKSAKEAEKKKEKKKN